MEVHQAFCPISASSTLQALKLKGHLTFLLFVSKSFEVPYKSLGHNSSPRPFSFFCSSICPRWGHAQSPPLPTTAHAAHKPAIDEGNLLNCILDNEANLLVPAISSTRNLLHATKLEPCIRRVVFTSTLAAVLKPSLLDPAKVYTEADWNPTTYAEAKASTKPRLVYNASKALASVRSGIKSRTRNPHGRALRFFPSLSAFFDPPIQPLTSLAALNRSIAFMWDITTGKYKAGLTLPVPHAMYVSARDVAQAHLRAAERDEAKNKRYLLVAGSWDAAEIVEIISCNFPALRNNLPVPDVTWQPPALPSFDVSKTQSELCIEFMVFEKVVVDTISAVVALEKQFGVVATIPHQSHKMVKSVAFAILT
ncbi:hypothetical protein B0H10DRAFT_2185796 [Mycena sp. CBHHK59/15]|nr:hypothetical protein B0H10DRAFT_2185796 [Mycena sp. CBHHK59/15]